MTSHPCCVERDILNFLAFSDQSQREPLLVLDAVLRIITANLAFYQKFSVTPKETQGRHIYELGNGQWNIPELRRNCGRCFA